MNDKLKNKLIQGFIQFKIKQGGVEKYFIDNCQGTISIQYENKKYEIYNQKDILKTFEEKLKRTVDNKSKLWDNINIRSKYDFFIWD